MGVHPWHRLRRGRIGTPREEVAVRREALIPRGLSLEQHILQSEPFFGREVERRREVGARNGNSRSRQNVRRVAWVTSRRVDEVVVLEVDLSFVAEKLPIAHHAPVHDVDRMLGRAFRRSGRSRQTRSSARPRRGQSLVPSLRRRRTRPRFPSSPRRRSCSRVLRDDDSLPLTAPEPPLDEMCLDSRLAPANDQGEWGF
jgi:hypothetical protein